MNCWKPFPPAWMIIHKIFCKSSHFVSNIGAIYAEYTFFSWVNLEATFTLESVSKNFLRECMQNIEMSILYVYIFFQTKNANKYWKKAIGNSSKPFINPSRILFYIRKSSPRTTGFFQFLHVSTRFYSMFFLVSFMLYVEKCSHWELKLDKIAIEISIMRIGHLFCAQLQHSVRIINEPK